MNSIIIPDYTPLCRFYEEEDESFQHLYLRNALSSGIKEWKYRFCNYHVA